MSKYIDSEKLIAEIERLYNGEAPKHDQQCNFDDGYFVGIDAISQLIDSLQQEQLDVDKIKRDWYNKGYFEGRKNAHIPARELGLPKSWDFQDEQSEVDLEKEVHNYLKTHHLHIKDGGRVVFDNDDSPNFMCDIRDIARHFYELGKNSK